MFVRSKRLFGVCAAVAAVLLVCPAFAEDAAKEDAAKDDGSYTISVEGGSTKVHQTFDKEGNVIEPSEESPDLKTQRQEQHKDMKRSRNERKREMRKAKEEHAREKKEAR